MIPTRPRGPAFAVGCGRPPQDDGDYLDLTAPEFGAEAAKVARLVEAKLGQLVESAAEAVAATGPEVAIGMLTVALLSQGWEAGQLAQVLAAAIVRLSRLDGVS